MAEYLEIFKLGNSMGQKLKVLLYGFNEWYLKVEAKVIKLPDAVSNRDWKHRKHS